jgi:alpha-1,3-fucosyltransferase
MSSRTSDSNSRIIDDIHRKNLKAVQLLTEYFIYTNWSLGELGEAPFRGCPEKRCYAFKPFTFLQTPLERSDAVMVHGPNLFYMPDRKKYKRSRKQLWVYVSMESQKRSMCSSHYKVEELDDWFNVTATFKPDSEVVLNYRPFQSWRKLPLNQFYMNAYKSFFKDKPNNSSFYRDAILSRAKSNTNRSKAFWYVSNCLTRSRREDYVNELIKYMDIDIFGKCTNFPNIKSDPCQKNNTDECYVDLFRSYKFYLAFENSLCNQYVTEKFWKLYRANFLFNVDVIPVVHGSKNSQYEQLTFKYTKKAFVNTENFASPRDLANYLLTLSRNHSEFVEYFAWKVRLAEDFANPVAQNDTTPDSEGSSFCEVCSRLHNKTYMNSNRNRIYKMSEWFNPVTECWDESYPVGIFESVAKFFGFCV